MHLSLCVSTAAVVAVIVLFCWMEYLVCVHLDEWALFFTLSLSLSLAFPSRASTRISATLELPVN